MEKTTSQHILSTASNLLGFCLFVIASLHITNSATTSVIDEFTSIIALLLGSSGLFSFLSIRSNVSAQSEKLETIADYLFIFGLAGILIIIALLVLNYIQ